MNYINDKGNEGLEGRGRDCDNWTVRIYDKWNTGDWEKIQRFLSELYERQRRQRVTRKGRGEELRQVLDRNKISSNIKHNNENKYHGGQHEKGFSIGSFFVCVCF